MVDQYAGGADETFFAAPQSAWGTIVHPVAANAIKVLKSSMTLSEGRE